ncbi:hypothetical protein KF840_23310 [bacterium]|nr:hypothetical protein [bacterium]
MSRLSRYAAPLALAAAAHLALLSQGGMLGCTFEAPTGAQVDDDMDDPNFYTCQCRCSAPVTTTVRVAARFDDAEQSPQRIDDTDGATDLDLGVVFGALRFGSVVIPPGATITAASLQLTADQAFSSSNATACTLTLFGEAVDDAPSFGANFANLAALPRTTASVPWAVPAWVVNASGPAQRSPDLRAIVQEIVNRPGWASGNALALLLASSGGRREAESYDGNPNKAAVLEIAYRIATDQALNVCMPASLNPNLRDGNGMPQAEPSDMALQNDCAGRVETTLSHMAQACDYPAQCECDAEIGSRKFNAVCNDPCAAVPLDPSCANFDPVGGTTTATNAPGDAPVCAATRNAARSGPSALSAAAFGQVSECLVEGPATIEIGDEDKESRARGVVELTGRPCPGAQCALGLAYNLSLDKITFAVRFHADPVFEDLASSGNSTPGAAVIGASGLGTVAPNQAQSSLRGRRSSTTRAYVLPNPNDIGVFVDWRHHTCALFGTVASTADGETNGEEQLAAEISASGDIVNQPPRAVAGADQRIECASPAGASVLLDGRASSDADGNLVRLSWTRESRSGPRLGSSPTLLLTQPIGETRYVLRALDDLGQTDEDATRVAVLDSTAPSASLSVSPAVLHKLTPALVPVTATIRTSDLCDPQPIVRLKSITSNEGDLADATHTNPDIQGAAFGTDDRQFQLRATHRVPNRGRLYTITYEISDHSGNVTTRLATVSAPYLYVLPYNPWR